MKKILILLLILPFSYKLHSQTDHIVDPNKKWFFGVELGLNKVVSYNYNEAKEFFQGGFLLEYFLEKNWSITGRLKYFKIGQSRGIAYNTYNSTVDLTQYRRFDGEVVALPINIKWEYQIVGNFRGNLKSGLAINQETVSEYQYLADESTDFPTLFVDYNFGLGFSYYLNPKTAIYTEIEVKGLGRNRDHDNNFIWRNSSDNTLINVGVKFHFKGKGD